MIRDLARKLTAFGEFVYCVIIELIFRRGTFEASAQVVKAHSSMALLRAASGDAETLLDCPPISASKSLKLKFKNFITAGEPLILRGGGNRFEIDSAGARKVLITVD